MTIKMIPGVVLMLVVYVSPVCAKTVELFARWTLEVPDEWVSETNEGNFLSVYHVGPSATEITSISPVVFAADKDGKGIDCPKIRYGLSFGKADSRCMPTIVEGEPSATESSIKVGEGWQQGYRASYTVHGGEIISYTFLLDIRSFPGARSEKPSTMMVVATGKSEDEIEGYLDVFAKIKKVGAVDSEEEKFDDLNKAAAALYQERPEYGYVYHVMTKQRINAFVANEEKRIAVFSLHGVVGEKYAVSIIYKVQFKKSGYEIERFESETIGVNLLSEINGLKSGQSLKPRPLTGEDLDKISQEGVSYLDQCWERHDGGKTKK